MRNLGPIVCVSMLMSCRLTPAVSTQDGSTRTLRKQDPIDEATVKAMSHALLDADGRGDGDAFAKATAPSFVYLEKGQVRGRDDCLKGLRAHGEQPGPPRLLTYGKEYVSIGSNSAVFFGEAVEHLPPNAAGRAADLDGWSTLVWVRDDGLWHATSWQWTRGGADGAREEANATYRDGIAFTMQPSGFLKEVVKGRAPGRALDVAMGQGRNALYLASQGWGVTGFDISDEGLRLARTAAQEQKLTLEAIDADMAKWDYGVEKWDLVVLIYSGCDDRWDAVKRGVKRGGLVVVEGFHKDAVPAIGYETGALSALFKDGFTVVRDEVVEDVSDWGRRRQKLVRFAAEKR